MNEEEKWMERQMEEEAIRKWMERQEEERQYEEMLERQRVKDWRREFEEEEHRLKQAELGEENGTTTNS